MYCLGPWSESVGAADTGCMSRESHPDRASSDRIADDLPVVVGLKDVSGPSLGALRWAVDDAVLRGASLTIVTVQHEHRPTFADAVNLRTDCSAQCTRRSRRVLADARSSARRTAGHSAVPIITHISEGRPVDALVAAGRAARELVVGSRGLGDLAGGLLGAISTTVAMRSSCPVVVVRDRSDERSDGPVIAGLDGGTGDTAVLMHAAEEAALRHTEVVAVHAMSGADRAGLDHGIEHARTASSRGSTTSVRWEFVHDRPVDAIAEHASGSSMVVVGSRGLTGPSAHVIGSTSRAVLHSIEVPIMVVPTHW